MSCLFAQEWEIRSAVGTVPVPQSVLPAVPRGRAAFPTCAVWPRHGPCLPLELLGGEVLCEREIRLLSQGQMFDFITQYSEL